MDMPSRVKIGPLTYAIEYMPLSKAAKRSLNGECDNQNLKIQVFETLPPNLSAEIMLHEILHACYHSADLCDDDKEEKIVTTMARQLAGVMKDNPDMVAWLMEQLADRPA